MIPKNLNQKNQIKPNQIKSNQIKPTNKKETIDLAKMSSFWNDDDIFFTNPWREMRRINKVMNQMFADAYQQEQDQQDQRQQSISDSGKGKEITSAASGSSKGGKSQQITPFSSALNQQLWTPRWDLSETDKEFHIHAELPGVDKKDVKVDVEGDTLSISGEKRHEKKEGEGQKWHRIERSYGSFKRSVRLPDGVEPASVKASFENGVLEVTVPKPPEKPSKAHAVTIEDKK